MWKHDVEGWLLLDSVFPQTCAVARGCQCVGERLSIDERGEWEQGSHAAFGGRHLAALLWQVYARFTQQPTARERKHFRPCAFPGDSLRISPLQAMLSEFFFHHCR